MIIFKDIISGDEMFSDIYPMRDIFDGIIIEVDGKDVKEKVGEIDERAIGGNASAEGVDDDEGGEGSEVSGCNIVVANRLVKTEFSKKSYGVYIKGYMKAIKTRLEESNPDRVDAFAKGATAAVKKILESFKDWDFYQGEGFNADGMCALLNYREDGVTPYMWFFKDGLEEEKV